MSAQEETAVADVQPVEKPAEVVGQVAEKAPEKRPNVTYVDTLKPPTDQKADPKPDQKPEAKPEAKAKPDAAADAKPEARPEAKPAETTDDTTETAEEQERDEKGRFKPKVQERIDELTKARGNAEREAAYWRGIAESRAAVKEAAGQPQAQAEKPTPEKFTDYAQYVEALTDWKATEKVNAAMAEHAARQQAAQQAQTWQQRVEATKARAPDIETVLSQSTAPISGVMAEAIRASANGPDVAMHLAKNPEVSARIAHMPPMQAILELGRIEATLTNQAAQAAAATAKPAEKRVTSAPNPPSTVGSGRSTEGNPAKMSMPEYLAWRDAQPDRKKR